MNHVQKPGLSFWQMLLGGDPRNALVLAGVLFVVAAMLSRRITRQVDDAQPVVPEVAVSVAH